MPIDIEDLRAFKGGDVEKVKESERRRFNADGPAKVDKIIALDETWRSNRGQIDNLRKAAPIAAKRGKTLIVEPINSIDMPGYFLNHQAQARSILEAVGADNVRLQFDLYHCQIMEGNLAIHLQDYLALIEHIQIAGVPGRHEPDIGEINYRYLFDLMDALQYDGWVGCEYRPEGGTVEGLAWKKEWSL